MTTPAVDTLSTDVDGARTVPDLAVDFSERRRVLVILICALLLVLAGLVALVIGAYDITIAEAAAVIGARLVGGDAAHLDRVHYTIIWEIRLPRILVGILVGFSLATAGAVYQGTFRNPLVEPFILGVSAGAAFGASLGILFPALFLNLQVGAFLFALVAVTAVYFSSRSDGRNAVVSLILAGVIIGSLFQALVSILKFVSDDAALRAIVFWIMGGFYYADWSDVALLLPLTLACGATIWMLSWKLNILSMGDEEARSLGVNPERLKLVFILCATLMTALAVSVVGIIAWVGLMMPHAARMILGPDHRFVIPAAALMGGIYILVCDTLARTLIGSEIPVSIITSILGAPFLFYLLRTKARYAFSG